MMNPDFRGPLRRIALVGAVVAAAGLASLAPAAAQDPTEVLARVGDTEITKAEVDLASEMFSEQLKTVPEAQRQPMVLDALIDMHIVADAARKAGLADTDIQKRRMEFLTNQALRTAYIEENVQNAVTDEELKARYEQDIAKYTPPEEVHAAHILVSSEEEAKAIIDQLAAGGDFAAIAKEKSSDPGSKDSGGDLGFFAKGQMVPEFETAAFGMEPGEVSKEPVKSQFGFHVIKVLEKRTQPVPTFEQVRDQLLPIVQRQKFEKVMADLKAGADVERFDAAAEDAAGADQPAADEGDATDDDTDGDAADAPAEPAPAQ